MNNDIVFHFWQQNQFFPLSTKKSSKQLRMATHRETAWRSFPLHVFLYDKQRCKHARSWTLKQTLGMELLHLRAYTLSYYVLIYTNKHPSAYMHHNPLWPVWVWVYVCVCAHARAGAWVCVHVWEREKEGVGGVLSPPLSRLTIKVMLMKYDYKGHMVCNILNTKCISPSALPLTLSSNARKCFLPTLNLNLTCRSSSPTYILSTPLPRSFSYHGVSWPLSS